MFLAGNRQELNFDVLGKAAQQPNSPDHCVDAPCLNRSVREHLAQLTYSLLAPVTKNGEIGHKDKALSYLQIISGHEKHPEGDALEDGAVYNNRSVATTGKWSEA